MYRITIYPCEVAEILGIKLNTAQTLIRTIKDAYGKKKHQDVTIKEFCEYKGLPYMEVFHMINKLTPKHDKQSA